MNQPTGALDFRTSLSVLDTIERANQQLGTFTVIITHNAILGKMADRVICLCGANLAGDSSGASAGFLDPRARAQAEAAVQSAEATCMQRNEQVNSAAAELDLG
jgi:ABC-type lipoprotein export system ATPase subunit